MSSNGASSVTIKFFVLFNVFFSMTACSLSVAHVIKILTFFFFKENFE